jgi:hypothetical protein
MTKIAGSGYGSESICQRHGSADPDPPQNVMDPQHCYFYSPSLWPTECLVLSAVLQDPLDDPAAVGMGRQAEHLPAKCFNDELKIRWK